MWPSVLLFVIGGQHVAALRCHDDLGFAVLVQIGDGGAEDVISGWNGQHGVHDDISGGTGIEVKMSAFGCSS